MNHTVCVYCIIIIYIYNIVHIYIYIYIYIDYTQSSGINSLQFYTL